MHHNNKPEFIIDHKDPNGHIHPIMVYRKDGKRVLIWGNLLFNSIREAKLYINSEFPLNRRK